MVKICFEVADEHAPALRSAIEEIRNEVGGRLEGAHRYAKQDALTYAATALGSLHAAIAKATPCGHEDRRGRVVPCGDPNYAS